MIFWGAFQPLKFLDSMNLLVFVHHQYITLQKSSCFQDNRVASLNAKVTFWTKRSQTLGCLALFLHYKEIVYKKLPRQNSPLTCISQRKVLQPVCNHFSHRCKQVHNIYSSTERVVLLLLHNKCSRAVIDAQEREKLFSFWKFKQNMQSWCLEERRRQDKLWALWYS